MSNSFNSKVGTVKSPYDAVDKAKGPKEIEKDLVVDGTLTVGGDLNITGCLGNLQLSLLMDSAVPPTDEVYEQYKREFTVTNVLAVQQDYSIDVATLIAGTGPDPGSSVYGYNTNQTLDLVGGKAKSYNADFTQYNLRYHGATNAPLTPAMTKSIHDEMISLYSQRGFQLQKSDVAPQFNGEYVYIKGAGQIQSPFISMKFFYGNGPNTIPTALDLYSTASPPPFVLDLYEPNQALHKNVHGYPIRIPVTTDFCGVFQKKFNVEPIVYYNDHQRTINVKVPESTSGYKLMAYNIVIPPYPAFNQSGSDYLISFDGSFSLMKRDSNNVLVKSNPTDCVYLVQSSAEVKIKSRLLNVSDFEATILFNVPGDVYSGAVCPLMNGESPSNDCYAIEGTVGQALTLSLDPVQNPANGVYPIGDNPATKLTEFYSVPNTLIIDDFSPIVFAFLKLPNNILKGDILATYPENVNAIVPPSFASINELYRLVLGHELCHTCQYGAGSIFLMPVEGMAQSMEMDTILSKNAFYLQWVLNWVPKLVTLTRRAFSVINSDYDGSGQTTYGTSLFWNYIATHFDTNHQVMRRIADILSNETAGPLFRAADYPVMYPAPIINYTGTALALNQALGELFGKNVQDVITDFSVALTLLRNNSAIPAQYRVNWPYWIYNSQYTGYPLISALFAGVGFGSFANWWNMMDTNALIPASWNTAYTGQTVIRTLPASYTAGARSLQTLSFNVPHAANTVTITVNSGTWRFIVVQFTSDGGPAGSWIQDGVFSVSAPSVKVFTITGHIPAYTPSGNIRLICVNVALTDLGGLNNYFAPQGDTGNLTFVTA